MDITLPTNYDNLTPQLRRMVREEYIKIQNGLCCHCNNPLLSNPNETVLNSYIKESLFPKGFFNHPIHLHHSHKDGLTIGAVHARCNAYLWQYLGE